MNFCVWNAQEWRSIMSEYEDMLEEWECHSNKLGNLMPKMHEALLKESTILLNKQRGKK